MKSTDPVTTPAPINTHRGLDSLDAKVHYPRGFRTANDNTHPVKNNSGAIEYQTALQHKRLVLSDTDIKALKSTPYEAVAAPGEDLILMPLVMIGFYNYGTAPYNCSDGALTLIHSGDPSAALITFSAANFGQKSEDYFYKGVSGALGVTPAKANNRSLQLYCPDADPTTGDGVWIFDIYYFVMDVTDYDSTGSGDGVGETFI